MITTIIDGVNSLDIKLYLTKRPEIPTSQQRVIHHVIDGRHGSLTELKEFENINLSIEYNVLELSNIKPLIREIKGYFFRKRTLSFSDDYDVFYKIKSVQMSSVENDIKEYGKFTVDFTLDPFQYDRIATKFEVTHETSIYNLGIIEANPLIKVKGMGNGSIFINGMEIKLIDIDGYVTLDSDLKEAYKDGESKNNKMEGDFPQLKIGSNIVSFNGGITAMTIEVRWRYL